MDIAGLDFRRCFSVRMGLKCILCLLIISRSSLCQNGTIEVVPEKLEFLEVQQQLFDYLFDTYNPYIPPLFTKRDLNVTNDTSDVPPDTIGVALLYAKIAEVNPTKQLLTVIFHYTTVWNDIRIRWNPEKFGNISYIYVQRKRVWIPDISPFDSTVVTDTRPVRSQFVRIFYNGLCSFPQSTVTSVNCDMNVEDFPFDVQDCSVRMLSYAFDSNTIKLENDISPVVSPEGVGNEEWDVLNISNTHGMIFPDSAPTPLNQFNFVMRRIPTFYVTLIIIPSFILTVLCIAGFFTSNLVHDDKEKYEMGLTTIMSSSVMVSIVSEIIPKTNKTPKLTRYIMANLLLILVATLFIIILPKMWQFIFLMCTSCKRERGWFRRNFWFFRGILTAVLFFGFEYFALKNIGDFLESGDIQRRFISAFVDESNI